MASLLCDEVLDRSDSDATSSASSPFDDGPFEAMQLDTLARSAQPLIASMSLRTAGGTAARFKIERIASCGLTMARLGSDRQIFARVDIGEQGADAKTYLIGDTGRLRKCSHAVMQSGCTVVGYIQGASPNASAALLSRWGTTFADIVHGLDVWDEDDGFVKPSKHGSGYVADDHMRSRIADAHAPYNCSVQMVINGPKISFQSALSRSMFIAEIVSECHVDIRNTFLRSVRKELAVILHSTKATGIISGLSNIGVVCASDRLLGTIDFSKVDALVGRIEAEHGEPLGCILRAYLWIPVCRGNFVALAKSGVSIPLCMVLVHGDFQTHFERMCL